MAVMSMVPIMTPTDIEHCTLSWLLYSKKITYSSWPPHHGHHIIIQECTNIFSTGGGESLAELCKVPFLGMYLDVDYYSSIPFCS